MTANSSDGVVEADVMRQFLLQCADNYGSNHNRAPTMFPGTEEEGDELRRSSSRIGIGSKLEELRSRVIGRSQSTQQIHHVFLSNARVGSESYCSY